MSDAIIVKEPATWRIVLAAILDFLTAFVVFGYIVAKIAGQTTSDGFNLTGLPALVAFALVVVYFVVGKRLGGTLWKRILGARRPNDLAKAG